MTDRLPTPSREEIALLDVFERLALQQIELVNNAAQAERAFATLAGCAALGFDTESKPTFQRNEVSTGPHIVQLATAGRAWVFQLLDPGCRDAVGKLLSSASITKVGFGLADDRKRIISKLGVEPAAVLDLNNVFWRNGYRRDMGVKGAVAVVFKQRFIKSRKATTSNWANPRLSEAQLVYAANDAYAALQVYAALGDGVTGAAGAAQR